MFHLIETLAEDEEQAQFSQDQHASSREKKGSEK